MIEAMTNKYTADDVDKVSAQFVAARLAAQSLNEFPGVVPPDLAAAYHVQEAAIRRWPERVGGWKVARIPPPQQARFPEERLIGPAFANNIHTAGSGSVAECPVFEGGFAAVEAELVIRVGVDAPADKVDWSIDEAMALVGELYIGIEVASSPLATLNDLGAGAVIADFGNNWGVVIGAAIDDWRSLEEVAAQTFIDGAFVGRGATPLRQGPLAALAFTLARCAQRGRPLRAGDVITTGMITGVHDISIGQQSRHVFEGLGEVSCRAVRAQSYKNLHGEHGDEKSFADPDADS